MQQQIRSGQWHRLIAAVLSGFFVILLQGGLSASAASAEAPELKALHQKEPYANWDRTASEARMLLQDKTAETPKLERIRATLAEQRGEAYQLSQDKSVDVRWLEAQLKSLGPEPKEGESEPEVIASRRA